MSLSASAVPPSSEAASGHIDVASSNAAEGVQDNTALVDTAGSGKKSFLSQTWSKFVRPLRTANAASQSPMRPSVPDDIARSAESVIDELVHRLGVANYGALEVDGDSGGVQPLPSSSRLDTPLKWRPNLSRQELVDLIGEMMTAKALKPNDTLIINDTFDATAGTGYLSYHAKSDRTAQFYAYPFHDWRAQVTMLASFRPTSNSEAPSV